MNAYHNYFSLLYDSYQKNRSTGGVMIDEFTNEMVGAGMII
jgi:sulfate adenylyltransferase subunit 1 (EFTu-like GTPase family)